MRGFIFLREPPLAKPGLAATLPRFMTLPPSSLEPAVRDPKKLRRTAWILVAIMIVGGTLILMAYNKRAALTAGDERPAMPYRISKERDLRLQRQDGEVVDLHDLEGKVFVIQTVSLDQPEKDRLSTSVMKRLEEHYAGNPDFVLVSLLVDPIPREDLDAKLEEIAGDRGMGLPKWWLGTTTPDPLHKFIKNELKTSMFPHEADGKWMYDTSLTVIDRNRHIRRAVVPQKQGGPPYIAVFDFDQAAEWDSRGVKTGTDLSNTGQLETLLIKTIDEVLAESFETP